MATCIHNVMCLTKLKKHQHTYFVFGLAATVSILYFHTLTSMRIAYESLTPFIRNTGFCSLGFAYNTRTVYVGC